MIKILNKLYKDYRKSDYSEKSSNKRFFQSFILQSCMLRSSLYNLNILDYGCGPGNMVKWLLKNNNSLLSYYGYDLRKKTINFASNLYKKDWITFSDILPDNIKWDASFLLGTISYQYDNEIKCKNDNIKLLLDVQKRTKSMVFTLPKIGRKSKKSMIRYSKSEIEKEIIQNLSCSFYIIDEETFSHEYIVGVYL